MTHALKSWKEYYVQVEQGNKMFELRKDDRPFTPGDTILLQEYDPKTEQYTGNESSYVISYILRDAPKFGLKPGYCILGIKPKE